MSLLFDFKVDKEKQTLFITREFDAGVDLVWDAYTKAEILDLWFGPKPYRVQTKEMNFTEGGRWLYAMMNQENAPLGYSMAEFIEIKPKTSFTTKNYFSDENGNHDSTNFTFSITTTSFKEEGDKTVVTIAKKMQSLAQLEKFAQSGYVDGTKLNMKNLDELLASLSKKS